LKVYKALILYKACGIAKEAKKVALGVDKLAKESEKVKKT
jgi:hypothetical protein